MSPVSTGTLDEVHVTQMSASWIAMATEGMGRHSSVGPADSSGECLRLRGVDIEDPDLVQWKAGCKRLKLVLRLRAAANDGRTSCARPRPIRGSQRRRCRCPDRGKNHRFHNCECSAVGRVGEHDNTLNRRKSIERFVAGKVDVDLRSEGGSRAWQVKSRGLLISGSKVRVLLRPPRKSKC